MSDPHRIASDLYSGVQWNLLLDPGPIVGSNYYYIDRHLALMQIDTAGAEARTLMPPDRPGLIATVSLRTHGGDLALLVSGTFDGTNSTINYTAAGQWATFISIEVAVDSWQWRLLQCFGVSGAGVSSALSGGASVSTLAASGAATFASTVSVGANLTVVDGYSIVPSGNTTGLKIGGASDKLGFYGHAPAVVPNVTAAGVTAAQLLTALDSIGILKSV